MKIKTMVELVLGGNGSSYSGGCGSGGGNLNLYGVAGGGAPALPNCSTGGLGRVGRAKTTWVGRMAGGGTGNPGGTGAYTYSIAGHILGNAPEYSGTNGTGGLLVIVSNRFNNIGKCEANGIQASNYGDCTGGSSGGGSINIFVNKIEEKGIMESNGGIRAEDTSGRSWFVPGGNGSTTIGTIDTGTFYNQN